MTKTNFFVTLGAAVLSGVLMLGMALNRAVPTGSWGLSFQAPAQPPAAPMSPERLRELDGAYWDADGGKVLYLTFDAGYENGYTDEILDILQQVKDQTTVLFSTHILSDVERICTDIAFLKDGKIAVQGKLGEVRGQNRTEEYVLETVNEEDTKKLLSKFSYLIQKGQTQISFNGSEEVLFQVLGFLTEQKIPVLKLERQEPTLESMFMEVLEG
jgi:ABC-2 type transport system ATP-binding protein